MLHCSTSGSSATPMSGSSRKPGSSKGEESASSLIRFGDGLDMAAVI